MLSVLRRFGDSNKKSEQCTYDMHNGYVYMYVRKKIYMHIIKITQQNMVT